MPINNVAPRWYNGRPAPGTAKLDAVGGPSALEERTAQKNAPELLQGQMNGRARIRTWDLVLIRDAL